MRKKRSVRGKSRILSLMCFLTISCMLVGCATSSYKQEPLKESSIPSVEAINVTSFGGERTVLEIVSDKTAQYTAFKLIDPPRLVLDIRAVPDRTLDQTKQINDGNVGEISVDPGKTKGDLTRIVVNLKRAMEYSAASRENIITMTLTPKKTATKAEKAQEPTLSLAQKEAAQAETKETTPVEPRVFFTPGTSGLNQVLGVDFTMLAHGKSRLNVAMDKRPLYHLERKGPKSLLLTLEKSTIPPLLMRRLDSSYFEGAVDKVKAGFESKDNRVSMIISLRELVPFHIDQTDSGIHIDFGKTAIRPPKKKIIPLGISEARAGAAEKMMVSVPGEKSNLKGDHMEALSEELAVEESTRMPARARKPKYTGKRMTMDFFKADVTNILRLIGEMSNLNIIWGPEVKGKVSMRLKNVPWDQALDLVLRNNNLGKRRDGNVIWITTKGKIAKLEAEEEKKRKAILEEKKKRIEEKRKAKNLEPLVTDYIALDFAKASEVKKHIVLSKRGKISVDARTNTLIIRDTKSDIELAKKTVQRFDTPVKQIMISARIVDASTNFSRDLGVKWNTLEGQRRGNEIGTSWRGKPLWAVDNTESSFPKGTDFRYGGSISTNAPDGWSSNIGFNWAKLTASMLGGLALDASLALAETEGKVQIISAPKVLTSNGEKATISRGDIIYKDVVTSDQIDTKELKATLSLTVTPTVSYNDYVTMDISVTDDKALGTDRKLEKKIDTKLMVKTGDTIVIGGIYKEDKADNESGIPWLRNIPIFGWLFKANTQSLEKTELLIFITPRVIYTGIKGV